MNTNRHLLFAAIANAGDHPQSLMVLDMTCGMFGQYTFLWKNTQQSIMVYFLGDHVY